MLTLRRQILREELSKALQDASACQEDLDDKVLGPMAAKSSTALTVLSPHRPILRPQRAVKDLAHEIVLWKDSATTSDHEAGMAREEQPKNETAEVPGNSPVIPSAFPQSSTTSVRTLPRRTQNPRTDGDQPRRDTRDLRPQSELRGRSFPGAELDRNSVGTSAQAAAHHDSTGFNAPKVDQWDVDRNIRDAMQDRAGLQNTATSPSVLPRQFISNTKTELEGARRHREEATLEHSEELPGMSNSRTENTVLIRDGNTYMSTRVAERQIVLDLGYECIGAKVFCVSQWYNCAR